MILRRWASIVRRECPAQEPQIAAGEELLEVNVVLVIIDSLRKDHVGVYGSDWIQTPHPRHNVFARDQRYAMFSKNDRSGPHLFDLTSDPKMNKNIAAGNPEVVKRMYNEYVLRDAGGFLPG